MAVPVFDVLEWFHGEQTRLIDRECAAQREKHAQEHVAAGDGRAHVEAGGIGQSERATAEDSSATTVGRSPSALATRVKTKRSHRARQVSAGVSDPLCGTGAGADPETGSAQ